MPSSFDSAAPQEKTDDEEYAPGSRVGRYTLVAPLASGGMAHVWTAEPDKGSGLGRTIAIKLIRGELASDREYARMFIDEANIASAIEHPNVCQVYDLEEHDGKLFMAMEWIPGDSLAGMIRSGKRFVPLMPALAVRICADACAGLHAAHEAIGEDGQALAVIHRDVSPPNILISLQGQVKVSDFGIAKARQQLHERTKTGDVKGKFAYLAPEQITGASGDRRIDVYAMGCVLYMITMGLRPFGNGPKAMRKILLGDLRKPTEIDSMYPTALEAMVLKALSHDPADRYQSADEMRAALEQWLVDAREVVGPSDVAAELKNRMDPEALASIEKLRTRRRDRTSASFHNLLDAIDDLEPPTAVSGIVVPPGDLRRLSESVRPSSPEIGDDDGATVVTKLDRTGAKLEEDDCSGWHRTGGHRAEETTPTKKSACDAEEDWTPAAPPEEQASPSPPAAPTTATDSQSPSALSPLLLQAALAGVIMVIVAWLLLR